eukprot:jgi/Chrzof1/13755/Cz08g11010.t1
MIQLYPSCPLVQYSIQQKSKSYCICTSLQLHFNRLLLRLGCPLWQLHLKYATNYYWHATYKSVTKMVFIEHKNKATSSLNNSRGITAANTCPA